MKARGVSSFGRDLLGREPVLGALATGSGCTFLPGARSQYDGSDFTLLRRCLCGMVESWLSGDKSPVLQRAV